MRNLRRIWGSSRGPPLDNFEIKKEENNQKGAGAWGIGSKLACETRILRIRTELKGSFKQIFETDSEINGLKHTLMRF